METDDNRIISEDILVKHFLPGIVGMNLSVRGITAAQTQTALEAFLADLDPSSTLEISDLIEHLYESGATYVKLPIDLVVMGAYGFTGMGLVIFGSVAKRISHKAPCSVMIVRERKG